MGDDLLVTIRAALERQEWQQAFDASGSAVATGEREAERLDLHAEAAWWLGQLDQCIAAREQAYRLYDEVGDDRAAGQCAVWLYEHHLMRARPAIAAAWLRRARRSLE